MKTIIAVLTVFLFAGYSFACRPILRIYESDCCGDDYVEVAREWIGVNNEHNLTAKGLKNDYVRTCPEGVWMGYHEENYTGHSYLLSGKDDGLNRCSYENTGRKFRSVKIVGSKVSYTAKAVTTYPIKFEAGEETVYLNDTRNINEPMESLIITGNEEIELFTTNYLGGLSVCIRPNNGYINSWADFQKLNNQTNGKYLYTNLSELSYIFGTNQFHSFKFGCNENTNTLLNIVRYASSQDK